jgi:hypothetical protein
MKAIVDKAGAAKARYQEAWALWNEKRPRTGAQAVEFLQSISKAHSGPVPDAFVDMVAQFQGSHEEDIDHIVFGAVDDIQVIISESQARAASEEADDVGAEGGLTAQDRIGIASVVQKRASELRARLRERRDQDAEATSSDGKPRAPKEFVIRRRSKHEDYAKQGQKEDTDKP